MRKRLLTALLVEDDVHILNRIHRQIINVFDRQIQVLKATTFEEAKEIAAQRLFDMSIIDIILPDGSGEALIADIKSWSPIHPVIVQTTIEKMQYQLKLLKEYERIKYLTKETLFKDLDRALLWAKSEATAALAQRIAIPGKQEIDSISVEEVCYVLPITKSNHLHVELYDWKTGKYSRTEIKNMTLNQFMDNYNALGYFLRCHTSCIVNKKMIKAASKLHNEITLLYPRENGLDVVLQISEKYKKEVFELLKGLY